MKESALADFGKHQPQAIVLDDSDRSRMSIARELRDAGFEVRECADVAAFEDAWAPGMFDLIVADWQLSDGAEHYGDRILQAVRRRDWDVPFILISGKLEETDDRSRVLQALLEEGQARFVLRGNDAFERVPVEAEQLLERRDSTLLKVILSLRDAAKKGEAFLTTQGGEVRVRDQLADLVASPASSHGSIRPLSTVRSNLVAGKT